MLSLSIGASHEIRGTPIVKQQGVRSTKQKRRKYSFKRVKELAREFSESISVSERERLTVLSKMMRRAK